MRVDGSWRGYDVEILEEKGELTRIKYLANPFMYFTEWVETKEIFK